MPLPPEFRVTETADSLRIEWDSRVVGNNRGDRVGIVVLWIVLAGFALLLTLELVAAYSLPPAERPEFSDACGYCCGLPFLLCAVVMLPYYWARRGGREVVEVTRDAITHRQSRWLASPPDVYPLSKVAKVVLAWKHSNTSDEPMFQTCVNVYVEFGRLWSRRFLGELLVAPLQEQLFLTIRDFAVRNDIPLAFEELNPRPELELLPSAATKPACSPMPLPPEFRVSEADGTLRVEWDNRAIEKEGCALPFVFWSFWAPATICVTGIFLRRIMTSGDTVDELVLMCFLACWLMLGWFITLWIPYYLTSRRWLESVTVARDALTHTRTGRLAPKPRTYLFEQVDVIAFGWDRDRPEKPSTDDLENPAIYILLRNGKRASGLAKWVRADLKYQLFQHIQRFLTANEVPVQTAVWGEPNPWVKW